MPSVELLYCLNNDAKNYAKNNEFLGVLNYSALHKVLDLNYCASH